MILCIGPTPAAQRVMIFRAWTRDMVNRATTTLDGAAGKSINVAKVLKALGEQPCATGFLGGDRGEHLRGILLEQGVELDFVTVQARTRQCITLVDESDATHTELVEESRPVTADDYDRLMAIIRRRVVGSRAVVMSGTITPGGPTRLYYDCAQLAHAAGAFSVTDAQGAPLLEALAARPGLVKPNRAELEATTGRALRDNASLYMAMRELAERGAERVVVTAGKEPTVAFDGKNLSRITPPKITPRNPIGSGDSFTAALVWRILRGDDLGEACRWGSASGAANALTWMAGEVDHKEVERLYLETKLERI